MKHTTIHRAVLALGLLALPSHAATLFGLGADHQLYRFDSSNPAGATAVGGSLANVVDIDVRGSTGGLYGMAASGETFLINSTTGSSTLLFAPSVSLGGPVTSFDFNAAVDRMRIVVGGNTNFRIVPDGIDGLSAGTVVNGVAGDGMYMTPAGVSILGAGYTNPFVNAPPVELFTIGTDGLLYLHTDGPEFNTMTAVGTGLGFTPGSGTGFDIDAEGIGYYANGTEFYQVDLATGTSTLVGNFGIEMRSLAVVPEPSTLGLAALAGLTLLRRRRA